MARAYSDQIVLDTLDLLDSNAGNVKRTGREAGVSESTVRKWRNERDEWAAEKLQARQEGREARPAGRVAQLLSAREEGDTLVASIADGARASVPEKREPLEARLHRTLATTTSSVDALVARLVEELPAGVLVDVLELLIRREAILAERLVNLHAGQAQAAGTGVLQLTLNMLQQTNAAA